MSETGFSQSTDPPVLSPV